MEDRKNIRPIVDEALESLDGIKRAEPAPWFYTRLMARMQQEEKSSWSRIGSFLARPAVAVAGLCLVLTMNIFFVLGAGKESVTPVVSQGEGLVESESIIASNSSFEYENLVQP